MSNINDFKINDGVLTRYRGNDSDVIIPAGVTSIGEEAFRGNDSLKSVAIPDSVKSIDEWAFFGCRNLEKVYVEDLIGFINLHFGRSLGVGSCKYDLYCGGELITDLVIPEGVTDLEMAFKCCDSLTNVVIPESVASIGDNAFDYCKSLTSVSIPNSVTNIGEKAFYFCESLTKITLPDSLTSIGDQAFYRCLSLTSITIPDSVTSIGESTFHSCENITHIIIPNGVKTLNAAFHGCSSLESVTLPEGIKSIDGAFAYCSSLKSITIPDGTTSLGSWAFSHCTSLTSITIPDSVTSFGAGLFEWCESLMSIKIPEGVKSIGENCFYNCESLTDISLPESVTSIGKCAFQWCKSLMSIKIPDGVTSIGIEAFKDCYSLMRVAMPKSLTSIGGGAFNGCSSLKEISIPDGVKSIGWSAFWGCKELKRVSIPDTVTVIGDDGTYYQKVYLNGPYIFNENTEVVFNSYLKGAGNSDVSKRLVFRKSPIQDIKSTNTKEYAVNGFLTTEDLSIYDESVIASYKKYLKGKTNKYMLFILENDTAKIVRRLDALGLLDRSFVENMNAQELSDEVKAILSESTDKCKAQNDSTSEKKSLSVTELKKKWSYTKSEDGLTIDNYKDFETKVIIPDKIGKDAVTEIGYRAFSPIQFGIREKQSEIRGKITSVTIPDGVTNIEAEAFRRCDSLETIMIPASVTNIDPGAFYGCYNVTVHAPAGSYAEEYAKEINIPFEEL